MSRLEAPTGTKGPPFIPVGGSNRDMHLLSRLEPPTGTKEVHVSRVQPITGTKDWPPSILSLSSRVLPQPFVVCFIFSLSVLAWGRQPPQPPQGRRQQGRLLQGAPARGQKLPDLGLRLRLRLQHGRAAHHQPRTATPASRSVSPPCALMRDGGHGVGPRRAATRGGGAGLRRAWRR